MQIKNNWKNWKWKILLIALSFTTMMIVACTSDDGVSNNPGSNPPSVGGGGGGGRRRTGIPMTETSMTTPAT